MAKSPPPSDKDKKPGFFDSITKAIDDVKKEIAADLAAMTPPEPKVDSKKEAEKAAHTDKILGLVGQASRGMAEEIVNDPDVPELEPEVDPQRPETVLSVPQTMPAGNMWENMGNLTLGNRFVGDACYHAPTVPDVESYQKALSLESVAPFTLALMAVGLQAHSRDDGDEVGDDLLVMALHKAIAQQPRLYGAIGAGPRQLWDDFELLDNVLTTRLNENPKIIALGPVGLDEPFAPYALKNQQAQLALQLDIAFDFGLPVLLTHRHSLSALIETLEQVAQLPTLIYMEPLETREQLDMVRKFGMYVVARPEVTNPEVKSNLFYKEVPADKLLLGSGSALVAPHGFQGHFNKPAFLKNTLGALAKILGVKEEGLLLRLNANMVQVFYHPEG